MRKIKLKFVYKSDEYGYHFMEHELNDIIDMDAICSFFKKDGYNHIDTVQSTGIKYNNSDDEIFEGDIVKLGGGEIIEIVFKDGGFGWFSRTWVGDFIGFAGHKYFDKVVHLIEKLGNKFENAELLKKQRI